MTDIEMLLAKDQMREKIYLYSKKRNKKGETEI